MFSSSSSKVRLLFGYQKEMVLTYFVDQIGGGLLLKAGAFRHYNGNFSEFWTPGAMILTHILKIHVIRS